METSYLTKKLSDVCDFKVEKNTRNLPYLGMEDIQSNSMTFTGSREPKKVKSTTNYFDETTVIYGKLRPYLNKVFVPGFEGHCTTEFVPLNPNLEYLSRDWLAYWLSSSSVIEELSGNTTGSRMPRADMKRLASMEIPLPPLAEQKKIVKVLEEKLGKVKEAIQLRNDAIADTEKILSAKLSEIFTEGKEKGWEEKELGMTCEITSSKRIYKNEYVDSGVPFYRTKEISELDHGKTISTELFISRERFDEVRNQFGIPKAGDLLLSAIGTIGKMYIVKGTEEFYFKDGNILWLKIPDSIDSFFVKYFLKFAIFGIQGLSAGSAYNALPINKLKKFLISVPDLKTQERIVKELDELSAQVAKLRTLQDEQLADLKSLERAYLHEAFASELV